VIVWLLGGCAGQEWTAREWTALEQHVLPTVFPQARAPDDPVLKLGLKAYCDPALSDPPGVSCNTCHDLARGGADEVDFSLGALEPAGRNSPSIANAAFRVRFSWDARFGDLQAQVEFPLFGTPYGVDARNDCLVTEHAWAMFDTLVAEYAEPYAAAFGVPPERDDALTTSAGGHEVPVAVDRTVAAIVAVVEQAVTAPSWLDYELSGRPVPRHLEHLERRDARDGARVFVAKGCADCHSGPFFTDGERHNIGLQSTDDGQWPKDGVGEGEFLTPPLRGVAWTAPYMHDGSMETLEDVLWHYSAGGSAPLYGERDRVITPLDLSDEEVRALSAFLVSLPGLPDDGPRPDDAWWEGTPPPPLACLGGE
jgi:cytochrome c peroxidase